MLAELTLVAQLLISVLPFIQIKIKGKSGIVAFCGKFIKRLSRVRIISTTGRLSVLLTGPHSLACHDVRHSGVEVNRLPRAEKNLEILA